MKQPRWSTKRSAIVDRRHKTCVLLPSFQGVSEWLRNTFTPQLLKNHPPGISLAMTNWCISSWIFSGSQSDREQDNCPGISNSKPECDQTGDRALRQWNHMQHKETSRWGTKTPFNICQPLCIQSLPSNFSTFALSLLDGIAPKKNIRSSVAFMAFNIPINVQLLPWKGK